MCNWEINFEALFPQNKGWTTQLPWTHSTGHMWSDKSFIQTVQVLQDSNRSIYTMVSCVSSIDIELKVQHPKHQIKFIRKDKVAEFSSCAFNDYCLALGIQVQHSVPYVHTQNGLVESLIKRIKLIARPLLQNCNLPTSCWVMQSYTLLTWFNCDQLHTMQCPHCN